MRFWMMAAAAMTIAAPASAQVTLNSGQGVTLTPNGDTMAAGEKRKDALSPADLEALGLVRKSYEVDKSVASANGGQLAPITITNREVPPDPIKPGRIEIVFAVVENKDTVMVTRNGTDRAFSFRARITARGQTAATDVCIVKPNNRGYEHWPYVIDKIELSEIELIDWKPGDPLICR